jgi:hypothetical protein
LNFLKVEFRVSPNVLNSIHLKLNFLKVEFCVSPNVLNSIDLKLNFLCSSIDVRY